MGTIPTTYNNLPDYGVVFGDGELRQAIANARVMQLLGIGSGGGGGIASSVTVKDGDSAVLLNLDANGNLVFPATQAVSGTVTALARTATSNPLQFSSIGISAGGVIKAASGTIYSVSCLSLSASTRYLHLLDKAIALATGDIPVEVHVVFPNSGELILGQDYFTINGLNFATGIAWGISSTPATYTAATANETFFSARYL